MCVNLGRIFSSFRCVCAFVCIGAGDIFLCTPLDPIAHVGWTTTSLRHYSTPSASPPPPPPHTHVASLCFHCSQQCGGGSLPGYVDGANACTHPHACFWVSPVDKCARCRGYLLCAVSSTRNQIFERSPEDQRDVLLPQIVELSTDEEAEVQHTAYTSLVNGFPHLHLGLSYVHTYYSCLPASSLLHAPAASTAVPTTCLYKIQQRTHSF